MMKSKARYFIRGAGSVMDLAPVRDLRKMAPKRTVAERMASHFNNVGMSIAHACDTYSVDAKTSNKTKTA